MQDIWDFLKELTDPESIIKYGGLALLLFVVFAETGLLIGFFLPGDSLIFISGLICSSDPDLLGVSIFTLEAGLMASAILGNVAGYWFGFKVGPPLFRKEDGIIFKKTYLELTRSFYERHGGKALILGRFLPIIRTFAPILAGVIRVPFGAFMLYNVAGAVLWIGTLGTLGYSLGDFPLVTLIPVVATIRKEKRRKK
jgi:membrane-associated protein